MKLGALPGDAAPLAAPAGTTIFIDGQPLGKDRVDRGILPGQHVIRLTAENHKAFEQTISVKPDEQYVLDKTLEPLPDGTTRYVTEDVIGGALLPVVAWLYDRALAKGFGGMAQALGEECRRRYG